MYLDVQQAADLSSESKREIVRRFFAAHGRVLVLVHATWCGHCVALMPEWQKAVAHVGGASSVAAVRISDAAINSKAGMALCGEVGLPRVQAFPTLLLIQGGKAQEYPYMRKRDGASIAAWAIGTEGFADGHTVATPAIRQRSVHRRSVRRVSPRRGTGAAAGRARELTPMGPEHFI